MSGKLPSDFPGSQWKGLRTSNAGSTGLIPDQGTGVPHAMQPKNFPQTNKPLPCPLMRKMGVKKAIMS